MHLVARARPDSSRLEGMPKLSLQAKETPLSALQLCIAAVLAGDLDDDAASCLTMQSNTRSSWRELCWNTTIGCA